MPYLSQDGKVKMARAERPPRCTRCKGTGVEPDLIETEGQTLHRVRKELGLTLAQLGNLIGTSPTYICDIEQGRKGLTLVMADRINTALEEVQRKRGSSGD